jgi:hypothetical protein
MTIKIYSGLSIKEPAVHARLAGAVLAPPIRRGDLYRDVGAEFRVVGIVDGEFLQNLAVSPGEIMDAMRCGLKVYGASSLGALRAVELESYGMIGCGEIFKLIKSTRYFKDDYLGQLFYETDARHATLPYMDLAIGLRMLYAKRKLSKKIAQYLLAAYEQLHFSERSFAGLQAKVRRMHGTATQPYLLAIDHLKRTVRAKEADALQMLRQIKTDLEQAQQVNLALAKRMNIDTRNPAELR